MSRIKIEQAKVSHFLPFNWQTKPRVYAIRISLQVVLYTRHFLGPWNSNFDAFDLRETHYPLSDASLPSFSSPPSSSWLVLSPHSLLLEAHPLRRIGPSQHPPPLVTRVSPSVCFFTFELGHGRTEELRPLHPRMTLLAETASSSRRSSDTFLC